MNVTLLSNANAPLETPEYSTVQAPGRAFANALAAAIDGTASAVERADGSAGAVAAGKGDVVSASVVRAKADVALEIVAVTASRISGAINTLLQTQV